MYTRSYEGKVKNVHRNLLLYIVCSPCTTTGYLLNLFHLGLYLDAQAALNWLHSRRDIDRRRIILFGRSLGGAVAIYLAASLSHTDKYVCVCVCL